MTVEPYLYNFYGRDCPWCVKMHPLIDRLEHELKVKVIQLEIWHHPENQQKLKEFADRIAPACGGRLAVPAFYNLKTGNALCGYVPYETLKAWALQQPSV